MGDVTPVASAGVPEEAAVNVVVEVIPDRVQRPECLTALAFERELDRAGEWELGGVAPAGVLLVEGVVELPREVLLDRGRDLALRGRVVRQGSRDPAGVGTTTLPHLGDAVEHLPHALRAEVRRTREQSTIGGGEHRRRESAHVVAFPDARVAVDVDANGDEPIVDVGSDPGFAVGLGVHLVTVGTPRRS